MAAEASRWTAAGIRLFKLWFTVSQDEQRRRFEAHLGPGGARFARPMRVNLMRRPVR